jgi:hypothetical protein|nr:MAG TPA: hypothetical protein [Caudoviricetes sp.]
MWLIKFYDALWRKLYQWSLKVQAQRQKKISLIANKKRELANKLRNEAFNLDTDAEDLEKLR